MVKRTGKLPPKLQEHTAYLITDVGRLYRTALDRRMKQFALTRSQWWLISFLTYFDGSNQQQLADVMDTGKGGIAKLVDRMEKKGFVRRSLDPNDARARRVHLAEKIRPLATDIEHALTLTTDESLSDLTAKEVRVLNRLLSKIRHTQIDKQDDETLATPE